MYTVWAIRRVWANIAAIILARKGILCSPLGVVCKVWEWFESLYTSSVLRHSGNRRGGAVRSYIKQVKFVTIWGKLIFVTLLCWWKTELQHSFIFLFEGNKRYYLLFLPAQGASIRRKISPRSPCVNLQADLSTWALN